MIPCAENCRYQKDGACELTKCTVVNSVKGVCPYFLERSADLFDRVTETFDADQPDGIGTGMDLF